MVEQNKKLLYIHSKNLNYYENDQIFSLINTYKSYIMVDKIKIGKLFTEYNECINAKYKKIISDKLYYIANLKSILKKLTPNVVVTREIFSLASFQVHLLKKKFDFIHISLMVCGMTLLEIASIRSINRYPEGFLTISGRGGYFLRYLNSCSNV